MWVSVIQVTLGHVVVGGSTFCAVCQDRKQIPPDILFAVTFRVTINELSPFESLQL